MYRPLDIVKARPTWDAVCCWQCQHEYNHTDKLNNVKTEAELIKERGQF